MRYAIAIWNFMEPGVRLADRVAEFADLGFDAVSFLPGQIVECPQAEAADLMAVLEERDLLATVHGSFEMTRADAAAVLARLGERLVRLTFDAAMTTTSCGTLYDAPRMIALLAAVEEASRGTPLRFAVEDFPLDAAALDHYRADLAPLLGCPRYGTLIDLGHLNLRIRKAGYFAPLSPRDYVAAVPLPIHEIHVHDNAGDKDSHAPMGFGNVAFGEIAAALRERSFDGISTIEIAPSFHGSTPAASKPKARESLDRWRQLWEADAA